MANMAKKDGWGCYQIGIYSVQFEEGRWVARGRDFDFHRVYRTLGEAHLDLTGEHMRAPRLDRRQRAKSRAWSRA